MISLYETTEYTGFAKDTAAKRPKGLKIVLVACIFLIPVVLAGYAYYTSGFYTDLTNNCWIRIRSEVHTGSSADIKSAINELRMTDKASYLTICNNIKAIHETTCVQSETSNAKVHFLKETGCYIKGTGFVFLKPLEEEKAVEIDTRVEFLRKLSRSNVF